MTYSKILGFVDNVFLMTSAVNQNELFVKVQTLAHAQINWAHKHGAIFNAHKLKWIILSSSSKLYDFSIDIEYWIDLKPVNKTKCVMSWSHCDDLCVSTGLAGLCELWKEKLGLRVFGPKIRSLKVKNKGSGDCVFKSDTESWCMEQSEQMICKYVNW